MEKENLAGEARVRSIYLAWCKEQGKESDEARFEQFSKNLLVMEEYSRATGKELKLNAYADCTEEEFAALSAGGEEAVAVEEPAVVEEPAAVEEPEAVEEPVAVVDPEEEAKRQAELEQQKAEQEARAAAAAEARAKAEAAAQAKREEAERQREEARGRANAGDECNNDTHTHTSILTRRTIVNFIYSTCCLVC